MGRYIGIWGSCDTGGLACSLTALLEHDTVVPLVQPDDPEAHPAWFERVGRDHDTLIVATSRQVPRSLAGRDGLNLVRYPAIYFPAFHPDQCYVRRISDGKYIEPHYNSAICVWCYVNGISAERAAMLFDRDVYEALGYFSIWGRSVDDLRADFDGCQLDFRSFFLKVKRAGGFMHSLNHPKAATIVALAKCIAVRMGEPETVFDLPLDIPDALQDLNWPIYPEIGEHFGLRGTYRWSPPFGARPRGLFRFIEDSYSRYRELDLRLDDMSYFCGPAEKLDTVLPPMMKA